MEYGSKVPHLQKISVILQIQLVFALNATVEDVEQRVNLPLIQGRIKSDLGEFKLCAGSEWRPGPCRVSRGGTSMLRVEFTIIFKLNDLWRQLCVWVVFRSDGINKRLLRLSHIGNCFWDRLVPELGY